MTDCSIGVKINIIWDLQKKPKTYTCGTYKTTLICKKPKKKSNALHWRSHPKVKFGRSGGHAKAQGWHVDPTVTLPEDEEVILREGWELGKETLQGSVVVFSDLREDGIT